MKKSDLKRGNLVVWWHNYVAQGAVFQRWIDERLAEIMLSDGRVISVNGSTFDVAASR